jgi:hypothetical protein
MEIKKWAAAGLIIPTIASAQVLVAPNQNGGELVITSRPCVYQGKTYPDALEAYSWSPTTPKQDACWTVKDGQIWFIYLNDGDVRVYPIDRFKQRQTL